MATVLTVYIFIHSIIFAYFDVNASFIHKKKANSAILYESAIGRR